MKNLKNTKTIDWYSIHKQIFKLQNRIVKQLKKKNFRKVRSLQRLLLKSFGPKLLASQKIININYISKFNKYKKNKNNLFLNSLNLNNFIQIKSYYSYETQQPNKSSKLLYLQFLQFLFILTLLPINETLSEPLSYNVRLYRTQADILKELYLIYNFTAYKWLIIVKPAGFLKNKNKEWLLKNVFLERKFLEFAIEDEKFASFYIKYYNHKEVIEARKISLIRLIRSSCFYGFDQFKKQNLSRIFTHTINKKELLSLPVLFYNDLIFIPGKHLSDLKKIYKITFQFLDQRGLILKKNRFWIINTLFGFNFLGWSFRKRKGRVIVKISRENIRSHQIDIKKFLKSAKFMPIDKVIIKLNKKITNWQSYYSYTPNLYKTWSEMNYYLFWQVWRWCKKKHKNKGTKWLYKRYWFCNEKNKWVFHANMQYLKKYNLKPIKIIPLPSRINACEIKNWKYNHQILLIRVSSSEKK